MLSTKLALRVARRWQDAWTAARPERSGHDNAWERLVQRFDLATQVRVRYDFVASRQFPVALPNLTADWGYHVGELARLASLLRGELTTRPLPAGDLRHWLAEVRQLVDEFGEVEVRWKEKVVRAVTEPVTLREVELGRFGIDFHWDRLGSVRGVHCFDVVALEPNPASGRDEVVHPHVQGHDLCAGDAAAPVQRALDGGNVVEAFLLIHSVLTTYNPGSPYVALDQWSGVPCSDCGRRVDDEDRYGCEGCDNDSCDRCSGSCACCMSSRCGNCLSDCAVCDSSCCSGCLETTGDDRRVCTRCFATCDECGRRVPKDDLTDSLCPDCQPSEEEPEDDDVPGLVHAGVEIP